ncbi:hypothetical protein IMZ48_46045 [Candidatus Bathyarchaeota archaeon]|nr:hypothetical protein [Candidatus Bathyarchaeota archaeon]
MAQAFLVMGQGAHVEPRGGGSGRRGGGGGGGGDYGGNGDGDDRAWGARGYGGPFGDGGDGCAVSPAQTPLSDQQSPLSLTQTETLLTHPQKDCVSSFWEKAEPSPTAFCDGKDDLPSCISSACSGSADEWTSYSTRSASLCSEYLSCSSTGTYTYSYQTPSGDWWGGGRRGGDDDKAWPTEGDVVVTGCPWNGDGWGFPYWGGLGYGGDFWDDMGPGWARATVTTTVKGSEGTNEVLVVEEAVSGDVSTLRTVGSEAMETGSADGDSGAAAGGGQGVVAVGAALGAVIALVGLM